MTTINGMTLEQLQERHRISYEKKVEEFTKDIKKLDELLNDIKIVEVGCDFEGREVPATILKAKKDIIKKREEFAQSVKTGKYYLQKWSK